MKFINIPDHKDNSCWINPDHIVWFGPNPDKKNDKAIIFLTNTHIIFTRDPYIEILAKLVYGE